MTDRTAPGGTARRALLRLAPTVLLAVPVIVALAAPPWHGRAAEAVAATSANTVTIDNFSFTPQVITVAPGTSITWTNRDDIPHSVVAPDAQAKSHALDTNESFAFKFDKPGEYSYFCGIHPHMTGKVIVRAGG
jgi:plastocyanin